MRNKQYQIVPEVFVQAVDRAVEAECQLTGKTAEEVMHDDNVLEVARFAVLELIPGPLSTAQARYASRRVCQELGNRQR